MVFLNPAVEVSEHLWRVTAEYCAEDTVASKEQSQTDQANVPENIRGELLDSADFVVFTRDTDLWWIESFILHDDQLVTNVLLNLHERTLVRSSNAVLDMHGYGLLAIR